MIQVNNLSKSYPSQPLFSDISFAIGNGEKVGLVGRNGQGKTTLLRIIAGEETPDDGSVSIPKDYSLGYMKQNLDFTKPTIIEETSSALPEANKNEIWRAEKILFGLGFSREDLDRAPREFSGGFQVRLNLAKLLLGGYRMLLLDEPTNYLDIVSIRWLENFLRDWKGEFILVTHDRDFMDKVVTHTLAIHRGKLRKLPGNTEKMYLQLVREEEIYEKTRINDEKEREKIEKFISRFRAKARLAGLVQSRIKTLSKMQKREKLAEIKDLEFEFNKAPFSGKYALEISDLSFAYDKSVPLIDSLSLAVKADDCIAVIGKNGKGKTTLLRLLYGQLNPSEGEIKIHPKIKIGYFGQTNRETLNPHLTVEEEILVSMDNPVRERARGIAGAMLFEGDMALKKVSVLSGGEKARVSLAKIIASSCNLLILDEPTNHLDMQATDAFLEAIDAFDGAVVFVSHNEMFLRSLPNRLVVFDNNRVSVFEGGYDEFLERVGWSDEEGEKSRNTNTQSGSKKDLRKAKATIITRRSKELTPLKEEIASLEKKITLLENEKSSANDALIEASAKSDGETIASLSIKLREIEESLETLYDTLDARTIEMEEKEAEFEEQLKELG
jgi:ATP-binding cassette subfamily F protein 3